MNRKPACSTQENGVACYCAHGYCLVVISGAKWSAQSSLFLALTYSALSLWYSGVCVMHVNYL